MDTLSWVITGIATTLGAILVFRANIRFDINEWRRDRRKRLEDKIRMLCPHVSPGKDNGQYILRSAYVSPPGTTAWHCQKCGHITYAEAEVDAGHRYWLENPKELIERFKKIKKIEKKLIR